jgi:hypothetical protein
MRRNTMQREFRRAVVALVLCVAAVGCASPGGGGAADPALQSGAAAESSSDGQSGATPGAPDAGSEQQSGGVAGAPGSPGKRSNGAQAAGAPIKLPAYTQIGAKPVDEMRQEIETDIQNECGKRRDNLCMTTVVEARDGTDLHACFGGTRPDMSTPDSTYEFYPPAELVIYSDPGDCGATDPGVDPQTTGNSEPTSTEPAEVSPPSSEATAPPEDGQAQPTSTT